MKKVPIQKFQFLFRAAVLCAVLTGLLFSCGEGIRLFPFPETETTKNDFSQLNFENKIPYQFNVHRLEDKPGNLKQNLNVTLKIITGSKTALLNNSVFHFSITGKNFNFPTVAENSQITSL